MEWFRLHAEILNDRRVQTLSPGIFKLYINALCHACLREKSGDLGTLDDVSFAFRETKEAVSSAFHTLIERGLIGTENETFHIPQWRKKQYKSDTSTERVKRFRKRYETVSETAPEQSRADTDSEKNISSLRSDISALSAPVIEDVSCETPDRPSKPKITPRQALLETLDELRADAVIAHRKALRAPLTVRAAELLAHQLALARDGPNAAADRMVERGWRGYNPKWDESDDRRNSTEKLHDSITAGVLAARRI